MFENLNAIEIGNRIKKKLVEFKYKQKDLVDITNLSKNAISNYISGNRIPDTNAIYKISSALNVSTDWLLTGKDKNVNSSNHILNELKDDEINIIKLYRHLDDRSKLKIEGMLEMKVAESKENEKGLSIYQNGENAATLKDLA
ncbi:helix-turn-helix domain-containing protein [Clostridium novyi]|uniref:helix-turn-helix domain-containing protein n=1 Tax=Clostridium novyi TaxID=1542 RepID=UPI00069F4EC7|nr:helix-turn-helix domain-containing protein [Clostridium novyi]